MTKDKITKNEESVHATGISNELKSSLPYDKRQNVESREITKNISLDRLIDHSWG